MLKCDAIRVSCGIVELFLENKTIKFQTMWRRFNQKMGLFETVIANRCWGVLSLSYSQPILHEKKNIPHSILREIKRKGEEMEEEEEEEEEGGRRRRRRRRRRIKRRRKRKRRWRKRKRRWRWRRKNLKERMGGVRSYKKVFRLKTFRFSQFFISIHYNNIILHWQPHRFLLWSGTILLPMMVLVQFDTTLHFFIVRHRMFIWALY